MCVNKRAGQAGLGMTIWYYDQKLNRIRIKITPCRIPYSWFFSSSMGEIMDDLRETFHWNTHWNVLTSWPWPMTLTYKLDLDILPLDLHAEILVSMSVCLAVRVVAQRHTHRNQHRRCQNYYTRHVPDMGCKTAQLHRPMPPDYRQKDQTAW